MATDGVLHWYRAYSPTCFCIMNVQARDDDDARDKVRLALSGDIETRELVRRSWEASGALVARLKEDTPIAR